MSFILHIIFPMLSPGLHSLLRLCMCMLACLQELAYMHLPTDQTFRLIDVGYRSHTHDQVFIYTRMYMCIYIYTHTCVCM